MGLFEKLPYSNFHELNLNWIIKKIKELLQEVEQLKQRVEQLEQENGE